MSERKTTILNKSDLKYLLIDSLKQYSEDVVYISGNNPYTFNVNKKVVHIFIHNVHESGKGRPNQDEGRIQINKTSNFLAARSSGKPVLFFGYFADYGVITAWNPFMLNERINQRQTISVYTRFSVQKKAQEKGISCYVDNNEQVIITFKPEYLGLYLENYNSMHLSDEETLLELIEKNNKTEDMDVGISEEFEIERKKFSVTHTKYKRDAGFRKAVYESYGARCAICGIQLELVEAAHIIPHSHEQGSDDPKNGLCLCSLHHKAYDSGLIYVNEDYKIRINEKRVEYLEKVHKDGGMTKFLKLQNEEINLPSSHIYQPSKEFLKIANKVRGILV
jgi:putative restriction endonuclease